MDRGWYFLRKKIAKRRISYARMNSVEWRGSVPEWLMGADCKSAGYAYASSNLARPIPPN
jgi:hypothetical protein